MDGRPHNGLAGWLEDSMGSRGLSQAQLARSVGVADTQVSRWRRGQVVPNLHYLQRLADTFGIQRSTLDQLVGLPVASTSVDSPTQHLDPELQAELQAHHARLRDAMQRQLPRSMWRAYVDACVALAAGLGASTARTAADSPEPSDPSDPAQAPPERQLGFGP